ncbi:hypothetical protein GH714_001898 [Hevea brasiliensis]|uniref:2-(3-amino-3-carboxypropyl)histidine synthase subunit 1 n=1 Tax=Hevea brasiliensis TaxID=3981 RepID=A0A6A6M7Z5_HEVBR|nr:hypothetical protein GH714_001898 [Hevea brasiliensis]
MPELEKLGLSALIPQSKPFSAGELLGCTAPRISSKSVIGSFSDMVVVFVADGRFHLEAFMIANPEISVFRNDPYLGKLFLEEYDHQGMKETRKRAIGRAREAKSWGIVLGTLGRQGNPRILDRLEKKMREKHFSYAVVLMSEISPTRIALFEQSMDAWIQIACPRLSIDWGEAFEKPLLTPLKQRLLLGIYQEDTIDSFLFYTLHLIASRNLNHMQQNKMILGAWVHQVLEQQMPSSDIPSKILCQVIKIDLQDMQRQTPCQQLIPKDLHGNEWHFQHVNQISLFVNCYFALKAWNAQNGGALAILVLDDKSEQMISMDTLNKKMQM